MGQQSILVVEDEPEISAVVSCMLRRGGYAVTEARGVVEGREAFDRAPKQFDLIVCDVVLREESGASLVAHVMRLCPSAKVLLISGLPLDILTARGLLPPHIVAGGQVNFRQKPFNLPELIEAVNCILAPHVALAGSQERAGVASVAH